MTAKPLYTLKPIGGLVIQPIQNGFIVTLRLQKSKVEDLNDLLKPEASPESDRLLTNINEFNKTANIPIPTDLVRDLTGLLNKEIRSRISIGEVVDIIHHFAFPDALGVFITSWASGSDLAAYFPKEAGYEETKKATE